MPTYGLISLSFDTMLTYDLISLSFDTMLTHGQMKYKAQVTIRQHDGK
jgi:hypothetical protein